MNLEMSQLPQFWLAYQSNPSDSGSQILVTICYCIANLKLKTRLSILILTYFDIITSFYSM